MKRPRSQLRRSRPRDFCSSGASFSSNPSGVLKAFSRLFHLFAHVMGGIPGFVDDLIGGFFGCIRRAVDLFFGLAGQLAHCPANFPVPILENFSRSASERLGALFEEGGRTIGMVANAAPGLFSRRGGEQDCRANTDPEAGEPRHQATTFSHVL